MAGPLGEMFDHGLYTLHRTIGCCEPNLRIYAGCDALNTTLEVILALRALDLTRSWWTVASVAATTANFYLTTWEEFHTGTLYLGVFSGPVEGIIIIIVIYIITAIYGAYFASIYIVLIQPVTLLGTGVWSLPLLSLPVLSTITSIDPIAKIIPLSVHYLPINIAFMIFSASGLAFNIFVSYVPLTSRIKPLPHYRLTLIGTSSYGNVFRSLKSKKDESSFLPFLRLLPFCISVILHVAFVSSPSAFKPRKDMAHSALLLPYMCFWGLEFAHQVRVRGRSH